MFGGQFLKNLGLFQGKPKTPEFEAFLSWAREYAIRIDSLEDKNADIERFSILDPILAGKRIVYLGEEDHWVHEKSDYRLLMLRYLYSRGFRYVGEELGWSDGLRVDRYLETGDESHLERIATYGYRGDIRTDRDDQPTGFFKDPTGNYPVQEFKSEQIRLTKALQAIHQKEPENERLHFFGFDIDTLAGGGYEDLGELLKPKQNRPAIFELQSQLARVPGETLVQEIQRLQKVIGRIQLQATEFKNLLGEKIYEQLREGLLTLLDSFRFVWVTKSAKAYRTISPAMAAREETMVRHVQFILSHMEPGAKMVLMAHNRHLSKNNAAIRQAGAGPGGKRGPSLGTAIHRLLPDQVFGIWMLQGQGFSSQPYSQLSSEYTLQPGTLNAILAQIGETFLLPLMAFDPRTSILNRELDIIGIYNVIFRAVIRQQVDALFFVNKVSRIQTD
jgi:erythromycin esterase-like protein